MYYGEILRLVKQQDSHMVFTKSSHCVIQTHNYSNRSSKSNGKHNQEVLLDKHIME